MPLGCGNNGPNVGINSTPAIDWANQRLYVIAYVNVDGTTPTYFLHALDLNTLADTTSPVKVTASHILTNGVHCLQRHEPTATGGAAP